MKKERILATCSYCLSPVTINSKEARGNNIGGNKKKVVSTDASERRQR